jgi:hypothetical protein
MKARLTADDGRTVVKVLVRMAIQDRASTGAAAGGQLTLPQQQAVNRQFRE